MASDNETVEQVFYSVEAECYNKQGQSFFGVNDVREIDRRFLAAHKREMAAKDAEVNRLRAIVVGLVDALVSAEATCADCDKTCDGCLNFNRTWIPNARNRIAEAKKVLAIYNG